MHLLGRIKHRIYPVVSEYISRTILAEGLLRGSGQPFRCLFADNSLFTEYLMHRMYAEPPRIIREWKIWIPALRRLVHPPMEGMDLCIAVLPERYEEMFRGLYAFRGREYVRQIIDTSGTWEEIRSRFHKKKKELSNTLIAKHGLSCRVSTDMKDYDFFYHRMYLPHLKRRFGNSSGIDPYDNLKSFFSRGFLLLVMSGRQAVAGALCFTEGNALVFHKAGILDGDETHSRNGAQMAVYYFQLRLAKEQGLRKVNAMRSRPFLHDGVYRTKREWGAEVFPEDESGSWVYFFTPRCSTAAAGFFENNPAIINTEDGLMGVVGEQGAPEISDEIRKDLTKRFYAPGLQGLLVLSPHAEAPGKVTFRAC